MNNNQALKWIDESLTDEEVKELLSYQIPSEDLTTFPVYMIRTTKERPDGKEKFEEFKYENLSEIALS